MDESEAEGEEAAAEAVAEAAAAVTRGVDGETDIRSSKTNNSTSVCYRLLRRKAGLWLMMHRP